jgi:hypothetical protein
MHNDEEEARLQVGDELTLQYIKENTNLPFNYAQSDDVSRMTHYLALQSLILNSSNNPGPGGIKALCNALKHHPNMTLLDLSYCNISDDECPHLADLLVHTKALRSLLLTDNSFEDEGLKLLSDAIIKNNTLHKLDIGGEMEFGNDGLTAVKEVLSNNRTLRQLIISLDYTQEKFVDLFCEGLEQNDCLRNLQIDHSSCWTEEQENIETRLNKVLKHNYALDTMHLGGSSVDCEALLPLLNRNKRLNPKRNSKSRFCSTILHKVMKQCQLFLVRFGSQFSRRSLILAWRRLRSSLKTFLICTLWILLEDYVHII